MNAPENVSATAQKVYEILASSDAPKNVKAVAESYSPQPATEERYKAIATVDSLIIKGIVSVEKASNDSEDVYKLIKGDNEVGPSEEADAAEEYVKKTDANEEEHRMIKLLEDHNKSLPAAELFDLYIKEQTPDATPATDEEIQAALQELTDAGVISAEGENYQVKK
jgi:hypothetical protein